MSRNGTKVSMTPAQRWMLALVSAASLMVVLDMLVVTTALNTSYMASQLALFGVVVGVALLLAGIGFGILAIGGALETGRTALSSFRSKAAEPAVPAKA